MEGDRKVIKDAGQKNPAISRPIGKGAAARIRDPLISLEPPDGFEPPTY